MSRLSLRTLISAVPGPPNSCSLSYDGTIERCRIWARMQQWDVDQGGPMNHPTTCKSNADSGCRYIVQVTNYPGCTWNVPDQYSQLQTSYLVQIFPIPFPLTLPQSLMLSQWGPVGKCSRPVNGVWQPLHSALTWIVIDLFINTSV